MLRFLLVFFLPSSSPPPSPPTSSTPLLSHPLPRSFLLNISLYKRNTSLTKLRVLVCLCAWYVFLCIHTRRVGLSRLQPEFRIQISFREQEKRWCWHAFWVWFKLKAGPTHVTIFSAITKLCTTDFCSVAGIFASLFLLSLSQDWSFGFSMWWMQYWQFSARGSPLICTWWSLWRCSTRLTWTARESLFYGILFSYFIVPLDKFSMGN